MTVVALVCVLAVAFLVVILTGAVSDDQRSRGALSITPTEPPAMAAPRGEVFGASANVLFLNVAAYTQAQIASQLRSLRATGATIARSDALWDASEPVPPVAGVHRYNWAFDDTTASALSAGRLRWLAILAYSPAWAASVPGQDHSPPVDAAWYAAYAGAFAERYGVDGSFWSSHPELPPDPVDTVEIWNEPDNAEFWQPSFDASRYGELYLRARAAIKAHDATMRVLIGGLSHPATTVPRLLAAVASLRGHVDGVAIHPYAPGPDGVLRSVAHARAAIDASGLAGVPIYVTEVGWTTSPAGSLSYAPAALRPLYIARTVTALGHTDCGLAAVILYTWVTSRRDLSDHEDWFGIASPAGSPTADAAAFTSAMQVAAAPAPAADLCGS